jgi:hypothetical protein
VQLRQEYNDALATARAQPGNSTYDTSYEQWKAANHPELTSQKPLGEIFPSGGLFEPQSGTTPAVTPEGTPSAAGRMVLQGGRLVPETSVPVAPEVEIPAPEAENE